jgi:hypothetical protein
VLLHQFALCLQFGLLLLLGGEDVPRFFSELGLLFTLAVVYLPGCEQFLQIFLVFLLVLFGFLRAGQLLHEQDVDDLDELVLD